jgi:hypothetical protein
VSARSGFLEPDLSQLELAQRYLAAGYPPVPILRPDAPASLLKDGKQVKQSPGKQPHGLLWSRKEREVYGATPAKVADWIKLRDIADYPGLGIACGDVAGFDIDVYDLALADAIEALAVETFGPTTLRRVGQAPKRLIVYRVKGDEPLAKAQTPELLKGDRKAKVEVLGQGQQFVAHGIHPATGLPFAWGEATPETTPLADLPTVTREQVAAFVQAAERMLRAAGYRTKAEIEAGAAPPSPGPLPQPATGPARPGNGHGDASPFKAVNDAALARPEAWVPALFPGARRDTRGVWRVSSDKLGRGLEEDISIAPPGAAARAGIVDFGEHDQGDPRQGKRTPIDLVIEHGGAGDAKRAAGWLADQLGVTLEFGREQGKANGKAEHRKEEATGGAITPRDEPWPEPGPLPTGLPPVEPFDPLLLPERLRPWVSDIAERMQCPPDFVAATAVVGLGSLIGRQLGIRPKRRDNWCVVPNLWGGVVGAPGMLKTPAMQEAMRPLVRLEMQAKEQHEKEMKRHEAVEFWRRKRRSSSRRGYRPS